jgi:hypothetical protein
MLITSYESTLLSRLKKMEIFGHSFLQVAEAGIQCLKYIKMGVEYRDYIKVQCDLELRKKI